MPRAVANKLYKNFSKGLITEATPLTYPENASIEEENCVLYAAGNRKRRYGFDFEGQYQLSSFSNTNAEFGLLAVNNYVWTDINNDSTVKFLAVQRGLTINFYDLAQPVISAALLPFSIDLTPYVVSGAVNPQNTSVSFAAGKGYLYIVGKKIEPIYVTYDAVGNSISLTRIYIQMRDFQGVPDGLTNDQEPTTLSNEHRYNLQNQGWVDPYNNATSTYHANSFDDLGQVVHSVFTGGTYVPPTSTLIDTYHSVIGRYPSNAQQWWLAQSPSDNPDTGVKYGDFLPELLSKQYFGNTHAPRGHYIVDAFNIDRTFISGITGLTPKVEVNRPASVGFFSGRAWYGLNNTAYYSQILSDQTKVGMCYQEADPTSEESSDLVASDGGVIPIPEMKDVCKLVPVSNGILLFASNGVWYISGVTGSGFTATDFEVTKVSNVGAETPHSIVVTQGNQIFWWSSIGIMTMAPRQQGGFDEANLTRDTIQSFYNNIPRDGRRFAKGVYDADHNVIQWVYHSDLIINRTFMNKVLNYDLTLQAFYPWTIQPGGNGFHPSIVDVFSLPENVLVDRKTSINYLTVVPVDNTLGTFNYTFSKISNDSFVEWGKFTNYNHLEWFLYNSYIITGFELMQDAMRKKMLPYIFCYFTRSENEYVLDPDTGEYDVDNKSSCMMQVRWDWSTSPVSGKYTTPVQVYRHRRQPDFSEDDLTFDTGSNVVVSKNKVRGSGKSIQFRFYCGAKDRDFDLLGWAVEITGNTVP